MFQHLQVSLEDVYNGTMKKLALQKSIICPTCKGNCSHLFTIHNFFWVIIFNSKSFSAKIWALCSLLCVLYLLQCVLYYYCVLYTHYGVLCTHYCVFCTHYCCSVSVTVCSVSIIVCSVPITVCSVSITVAVQVWVPQRKVLQRNALHVMVEAYKSGCSKLVPGWCSSSKHTVIFAKAAEKKLMLNICVRIVMERRRFKRRRYQKFILTKVCSDLCREKFCSTNSNLQHFVSLWCAFIVFVHSSCVARQPDVFPQSKLTK